MERNEVFNTLKDYLNEWMTDKEIPAVEITDDLVLSQLGVTSVDFVLLLVYFEEELDLMFEDDDLLMSNDITIGEMIDRIMKLVD